MGLLPASLLALFLFMAGAIARGRALLAAPIAFQPKPQSSFPVQHSAVAFSAGFVLAWAVFLAWLFNLD